MTAMGQSRKSRPSGGMSALPPGADIVMAGRHVRKVPTSDIHRSIQPHLVGGIEAEIPEKHRPETADWLESEPEHEPPPVRSRRAVAHFGLRMAVALRGLQDALRKL